MAIANVPPNAIRLFGAGATPQIQNLQFDLGAFVLSSSTKYLNAMSHLEFMQRESSKNMDFHMENMESLQKEAYTTVTFLFVVVSASFSGAVKIFSGGNLTGLALALSVLCVYLAGLAAYLVFACLMARTVKAPANEPKNLKLPAGYTSEEMQEFELEKLQERIQFNVERNARTARHLNIVRVLICASPLVFLATIVFFWVLSVAFGAAWF